ncbi:RES family NAD+ phosphorylase [Duganella sp. BJB1802]|uniref:RES family NAD+ phosphorylase n=1 Tax=Duganella sp. BJB1802 TaxID=2744575 RepID=UPI001594C8D1|nr:RES family NAD+ phosphorylase [Duganella sp. BJB1802]NVD73437.1 RES family NAD+ phosphorylase [Duganella sp. BJB1802]
MSSKKKAHVPPSHIARTLPSDARIWQALRGGICELKAGTLMIRAAWNPESVWPERVEKTYRFGPPAVPADDNGAFAFHWIYLGDNVITAAWEAQLCVNDASMPGTFFFKRNAADALIAEMTFTRDLRLLDLTGDAVSKLGIYAELLGPGHEWCQWLGCVLDRIIARHPHLDGIRYMSRKHPGHYAYAISSRRMAGLDMLRRTSIARFEETAEYLRLQRDPCFSKF